MAAPEVLSFREFRAGLAGVARAVAALSASRLTGLERRRLPGRDDLARPQACHRCILGDVYGWARAAAHRVHRERISVLPAAAPGVLRRGRVRPASRSRPAAGPGPRPVHHRPGRVLADVNALHPFREGNGRAQWAFFSQLAHDAGHHIAWVRMDLDRNMAASAASRHGDLAPLREMPGQLTDLPHPSKPPGPDRRAGPQSDLSPDMTSRQTTAAGRSERAGLVPGSPAMGGLLKGSPSPDPTPRKPLRPPARAIGAVAAHRR